MLSLIPLVEAYLAVTLAIEPWFSIFLVQAEVFGIGELMEVQYHRLEGWHHPGRNLRMGKGYLFPERGNIRATQDRPLSNESVAQIQGQLA